MILMHVSFFKCFLSEMFPFSNVSFFKCFLFQMYPFSNVSFFQMFPFSNVSLKATLMGLTKS